MIDTLNGGGGDRDRNKVGGLEACQLYHGKPGLNDAEKLQARALGSRLGVPHGRFPPAAAAPLAARRGGGSS